MVRYPLDECDDHACANGRKVRDLGEKALKINHRLDLKSNVMFNDSALSFAQMLTPSLLGQISARSTSSQIGLSFTRICIS